MSNVTHLAVPMVAGNVESKEQSQEPETPCTALLGRVWRQDGKTLILVYDENGVGRWLGGLDWMPIEYRQGKCRAVKIFINNRWWNTYETELEIQTLEQIYGFPFLCGTRSKKTMPVEKMQERLLNLFDAHFCDPHRHVLRVAAHAFLNGVETGLVEQSREQLTKELAEAQLCSARYCERNLYGRAAVQAVAAYWLRRVLNARRNTK